MSFWKEVENWWKKWGCYIILLLVVVLFLYLWISGNHRAKEGETYLGITNPYVLYKLFKKKRKAGKKHETECRRIVENIYHDKFPTVRPSFLRYYNGKNLELDMYNERLGIALEYNGIQHYQFVSYFHKTPENFEEQVKRDNFKRERCQELGIKLIEIPHTIPFNKLGSFIVNELYRRNLLPSDQENY